MRTNIKWSARIAMMFAIVIFTACAKHTTPKKVDRLLSEGTWKIAQAKVDGVTITSNYNGVIFNFSDQGVINVTGTTVTQGSWSLGGEKNPVVLFMAYPITATNLYGFSDDWLVMEMTKSECSIKRNESAEVEDIIVFRRID